MSQTQLNRFAVISKVIDGHMTISEAAVSLGISQRQTIRLKEGVIAQGASFLIHKNTGRKPSHAFDDHLTETILALKQSQTYQNANFLHFQELLEEYLHIRANIIQRDAQSICKGEDKMGFSKDLFVDCVGSVAIILEDRVVLQGQLIKDRHHNDQQINVAFENNFVVLRLTCDASIIRDNAQLSTISPTLYEEGDIVRINVANISAIGPSHGCQDNDSAD